MGNCTESTKHNSLHSRCKSREISNKTSYHSYLVSEDTVEVFRVDNILLVYLTRLWKITQVWRSSPIIPRLRSIPVLYPNFPVTVGLARPCPVWWCRSPCLQTVWFTSGAFCFLCLVVCNGTRSLCNVMEFVSIRNHCMFCFTFLWFMKLPFYYSFVTLVTVLYVPLYHDRFHKLPWFFFFFI